MPGNQELIFVRGKIITNMDFSMTLGCYLIHFFQAVSEGLLDCIKKLIYLVEMTVFSSTPDVYHL